MDAVSYLSSLRSVNSSLPVIPSAEARSYISTLNNNYDYISADYFPPIKCIKHAIYQQDEDLESYFTEYFSRMMGLEDNSYLGNFGDMFFNLSNFGQNSQVFIDTFLKSNPEYYQEAIKYFLKNHQLDNLEILVKQMRPNKSLLPELTKYYFKLDSEEMRIVKSLIPDLPDPKIMDNFRSQNQDQLNFLVDSFEPISFSPEYKEMEDLNSKISKLGNKNKESQNLIKQRNELQRSLQDRYPEFYKQVESFAIIDTDLFLFLYFLDLELFFIILDKYPIKSKMDNSYHLTKEAKIKLISNFPQNHIYRILSYGNNNLMNYFFRLNIITLDEFNEKNKVLIENLKFVRHLNIVDDLLTNLKVPKKMLLKLLVSAENIYPLILKYME